jgi:hypothetical protein
VRADEPPIHLLLGTDALRVARARRLTPSSRR